MMIQNARRWSKFSTLQSLGGTVGLTLLALMIRYSLAPFIQPFAVFHFFILSCLAIQFFFGYRYSLAAMVASVFLGQYFFVEPLETFNELSPKDIIISFNFITVTLAAIALMETLQRAIYAREMLLKVSNSRHGISLQRENDRIYYAQKSSAAWYVLEVLIKEFERIILIQHGQDPVRLEPLFYQLTGLDPADISNIHWLDCVHPEDRPIVVQRLESTSASTPGQQPFGLRFKKGNEFSQESTFVSLMRFEFMGHPLFLLSLGSSHNRATTGN